MRLSLLRRLVTPAFSGAILILLVITIAPVVFGSLNDVPDDAPVAAGPVCILVTFALMMGLLLRGSATLRTWSTLIGIAAGAVAGVVLGIYDFEPVREAPVAGTAAGRMARVRSRPGRRLLVAAAGVPVPVHRIAPPGNFDRAFDSAGLVARVEGDGLPEGAGPVRLPRRWATCWPALPR